MAEGEAHFTASPLASTEVPPNHIRVWFVHQAETNILDCYDFPYSDDLTFRELRTLIALKSERTIFSSGLVDKEAKLFPLDSPVPTDERIILVRGPDTPDHFFGPYLDWRSVILLSVAEIINGVLSFSLFAVFVFPTDLLIWRNLDIMRCEGSALTFGQLLRRAARTEGLWSLVRGALPLSLILSTAMQFAVVAGSTTEAPLTFWSRRQFFMLSVSGIAQFLANPLVCLTFAPRKRRHNFISEISFLPTWAQYRSKFGVLWRSLPFVAFFELIRTRLEEPVSDDGTITRWLISKGYDATDVWKQIPVLLVRSLFTLPVHQILNWVILGLPDKSPLTSLRELIATPSRLYTSLPLFMFMEVTGHLALTAGTYGQFWASVIRPAELARQPGRDDKSLARRLIWEAVGRWAVALSAVGAALYIWRQID